MSSLTLNDVQALTRESSGEVRAQLAHKIAKQYNDGNFNELESEIASDIFRILLKDAEKMVRMALAEQLAACPSVPHDVVLRLARDESDVAHHVLANSPVLTDEDLLAIIKSTKEVLKLCAIARREHVSEGVSGMLLDTRNELVLKELFTNKKAQLSEAHLLKSWDYVSARSSLLEVLVQHGNLPVTVAKKAFDLVSDEWKKHLSTHYKISEPFANKTVNDASEWEMIGLLPSEGGDNFDSDDQVEELVEKLYSSGMLTHSMLMRALCMGSINLFEAGLARLAHVPRINARILLMESSGIGFDAIYKKGGMPEGFMPGVRALLRICLQETEYGRSKPMDFRKRVIDRIYIEGYHRSVDNMDYLLSIIGGKIGGNVGAQANIH